MHQPKLNSRAQMNTLIWYNNNCVYKQQIKPFVSVCNIIDRVNDTTHTAHSEYSGNDVVVERSKGLKLLRN